MSSDSDLQLVTKEVGELCFTFQPGSGKVPTKGKLTVSSNGKNLKIHTFDIANENSRSDFITGLLKDNPALAPTDSREDIASCLLDFAATKWETVGKNQEDDTPAEDDFLLKTLPKEAVDDAMDMLTSDDLFERIAEDIENLGITGEDVLSKTLYLIMTSRYLSEPLAAIIQGASSSGKSFNVERVAEFIPPQGKVMAHDFSEQALSYKPPGTLKHKVVICGERLHNNKGGDGHAQDNSKAFREMRASGKYVREVVGKNDKGVYETRHIEQDGPIAYIESTTATYIPDEDSTRLIKLSSNESAEQTSRIQELHKRKAKGQTTETGERMRIINKHHALQSFLAPFLKEPPQIIIPFIDHITLPNNVVSTRRTFPYVVSMIGVIALLRQFQSSKTGGIAPDWEQRRKEGKLTVVADREDYRIVYPLVLSILEKMYGSLPSVAKQMLNKIKAKTGKVSEGIPLSDGRKTIPKESMVWREFTATDCMEWAGIGKTEVWRRLKSLGFAGILSCDKNAKPFKYKVVNPELADTVDILGEGLPTPDKMDELIKEDTSAGEGETSDE